MSPNQIVLRNLIGVVVAMTAITAVALVLGSAGRTSPAMSAARAAPTRPRDPIELGARLYETKGCVACHSIDGSPKVGPSFKGSWGSDIVLADGITLRFDAAYVRESLVHPHAQARAGFPPTMPSFEGLLDERELDALIAFLASLRQPPATN